MFGKKLRPVTPEEIITVLKATGADGVDISFNREIVTKEFIDKVKSAGFEFHVWTIDDLGSAVVAFRRGADTVTTNRAREMRLDYLEALDLAAGR
jgi:glycerophosphoryl diester phosphodiesterase